MGGFDETIKTPVVTINYLLLLLLRSSFGDSIAANHEIWEGPYYRYTISFTFYEFQGNYRGNDMTRESRMSRDGDRMDCQVAKSSGSLERLPFYFVVVREWLCSVSSRERKEKLFQQAGFSLISVSRSTPRSNCHFDCHAFHLTMRCTHASVLTFFGLVVSLVAAKKSNGKSLEDLDYRIFPRRTEEEAAVLEWGHSAIISALDASVAHFGPQTAQAALLEVECQPILASPLNGVTKENVMVHKLDNAEEVHGNMVIMTNQAGLSGVELATIAKVSGAAALLVVNVDSKQPDDIYRLTINEEEQEAANAIDIPVVMISYNSANVLTTATVTNDMKAEDVVNNGMPDRVRLYSGGDRPFFEDVEPSDPTLYLIHNLLTAEECDTMIESAQAKMKPVKEDNLLEFLFESNKMVNMQSAMLWQGIWQTPGAKGIEERIEQVTGFPSAHYSDFVVDRFEKGSYWNPHYDDFTATIAMATITIFLSTSGSPVVYPSAKQPIKINPRRGMAIVHHNTNDRENLDLKTIHAMLTFGGDEPIYIARKYILTSPVSRAHRMVLPALAIPFGGLPIVVTQAHAWFLAKFGTADGSSYFDKACVFLPLVLILGMVQVIADNLMGKKKETKRKKTTKKE